VERFKFEEKDTCCFCGTTIDVDAGDWPCQAWPIMPGRVCCNECNMERVVPARLGITNDRN